MANLGSGHGGTQTGLPGRAEPRSQLQPSEVGIAFATEHRLQNIQNIQSTVQTPHFGLEKSAPSLSLVL